MSPGGGDEGLEPLTTAFWAVTSCSYALMLKFLVTQGFWRIDWFVMGRLLASVRVETHGLKHGLGLAGTSASSVPASGIASTTLGSSGPSCANRPTPGIRAAEVESDRLRATPDLRTRRSRWAAQVGALTPRRGSPILSVRAGRFRGSDGASHAGRWTRQRGTT